MVLTQSLVDLASLELEPIEAYFDEVELSTSQGNGYPRSEHVRELIKRAGNKIVVGAKFSFRPAKCPPGYGRETATLVGDECRRKVG